MPWVIIAAIAGATMLLMPWSCDTSHNVNDDTPDTATSFNNTLMWMAIIAGVLFASRALKEFFR